MRSLFLRVFQFKNILHIYRICSWLLTSSFYLYGQPGTANYFQITVVALLFLSALLMIWLYEKVRENKTQIKFLLLIETIGITLFLLPTGTLDSPFIWYALNPVLVAGNLLSTLFSWVVLLFYTLSTSIMAYSTTLDTPLHEDLFYGQADLLLVFLLITLAVQALSFISNQLKEKNVLLIEQKNDLEAINKKLVEANNQNQESLKHIMALYQLTDWITAKENKDNLIKTFVEFTKQLSKSKSTFFWRADLTSESDRIEFLGDYDKPMQTLINEETRRIWTEIQVDDDCTPTARDIGGHRYLVVSINTSTGRYGILGIELDEDTNAEEVFFSRQLSFLGNVFSVIFDRFYHEEINHQLILLEEQNRIANEIHDSVSQRLFSIVYAIHALKRNSNNKSEEEHLKILNMIEESSKLAAQELRECIYRLSSRKNEDKNYLNSIHTYLIQLSELNNVTVDFKHMGMADFIPIDRKQMIFRMILESVGNAIKHGKARGVKVELHIDKEDSRLTVVDDGQGFNPQKLINKGLGIDNIKELVELNGGEFQLISTTGFGASVKIYLPHRYPNKNKEEIA